MAKRSSTSLQERLSSFKRDLDDVIMKSAGPVEELVRSGEEGDGWEEGKVMGGKRGEGDGEDDGPMEGGESDWWVGGGEGDG